MKKLEGLLCVLFILICLSSCNKNIAASVDTYISETFAVNTPWVSTPTLSPSPTPIPIPKLTATILSAGDVIMHDAVIQSGKKDSGDYDYTGIFKEIKPYVQKSDFSIISYEGVSLDSDKNYTGYPLFNAPPAIMEAFSDTGFKMVNTGNNHCLDRGLKGLLETGNIIKQLKMQVIGTFQDIAVPRHKIHDLNGIKVGFLSYTYGCNMNENRLTKEEQDIHLNLIDNEKLKMEIEALSKTTDMVVVLVHWGIEYRQEPTDAQKKLADSMFLWGADIVLGSHPHVVEPSEIRETDGKNKYVIYSMGNFLSNQIGGNNPNPRNNDLTEDSMMISLEIEKDLETGKTSLTSVKHIPTWVYRYMENGIYQYTIFPIPSPEHESLNKHDDTLAEKLRNSYNRTMSMVKDWDRESDSPQQ